MTRRRARLVLEDGSAFEGVGCGADGVTSGEVVFNTSMTGYQEVLTDPVLRRADRHDDVPGDRQLRRDGRRRRVAPPLVAGFIVREGSPMASNWRSGAVLEDYLRAHGIVAIADIDTRALTRRLRSGGVMRGVIATGEVAIEAVLARARDAADGRVGPGARGDLRDGVRLRCPADAPVPGDAGIATDREFRCPASPAGRRRAGARSWPRTTSG